MNHDKIEILKNRKGFIAALDQSGGSSGKTLALYGIDKEKYQTEIEMFDLIHEYRKRIITSKKFTKEKILGVILFEETVNRKIEGEYSSNYLWNQKQILSFLKIDKGLAEKENGVQLMKPIPNLAETLEKAKEKNIIGTKMRSVIYNDNKEGIKNIVQQQFTLAKTIWKHGLIPIIEPEISIESSTKEECEIILKNEINKQLQDLDDDIRVIFKFTIPTKINFYQEFINNKKVLKVVALSGGYTKEKACKLLSKNNGMIASFSRALLEGLKETQTQQEFDSTLEKSLNEIYAASIK